MFLIYDNADNSNFPSAECFNYLLDALNNGSTTDDKPMNTGNNYTDQERYELLLLLEGLQSYHCFRFTDDEFPLIFVAVKDLTSQIAHLQLR